MLSMLLYVNIVHMLIEIHLVIFLGAAFHKDQFCKKNFHKKKSLFPFKKR